jgi:hypothetical protein
MEWIKFILMLTGGLMWGCFFGWLASRAWHLACCWWKNQTIHFLITAESTIAGLTFRKKRLAIRKFTVPVRKILWRRRRFAKTFLRKVLWLLAELPVLIKLEKYGKALNKRSAFDLPHKRLFK